MAYLIAIGTSDGKNVDQKFGEVSEFTIYEAEGTDYYFKEKRVVPDSSEAKEAGAGCADGGCSGGGHGCGGAGGAVEKVELISDCRCVLCTKIGFQAMKQFERKAISVFDVTCGIDEALEKITSYYERRDYGTGNIFRGKREQTRTSE
jgi:hypothetical protein